MQPAIGTHLPRKIPVDMHIGNGDPRYQDVVNDYDRFVAEGWGDGQTIFYTIFVGGIPIPQRTCSKPGATLADRGDSLTPVAHTPHV